MAEHTKRLIDTVPIGGDPNNFCQCLHHEMNHADYYGMNCKCNQTECKCTGYTPARDDQKRTRDLLVIEEYMRDEGGDKYASDAWDALQRHIAYNKDFSAWYDEQQRKFERWKANPDGPQAA